MIVVGERERVGREGADRGARFREEREC